MEELVEIKAEETSPEDVKLANPQKWQLFLRSFFLLTLMNYTRMQGLGFGMAMIPIAKKMKLKEWDLSGFLRRHLDFFNANPYIATYALGAAARAEMERQKPASTIELKSRLMGPLGLLGDQVFWAKWKPFCAAAGILIICEVSYPASMEYRLANAIILLGIVLIYNTFHFAARWNGLIVGLNTGINVPEAIAKSRLVRIRYILGFCTAFITGMYLVKAVEISNDILIFMVSFAVVLVSRWKKGPIWLALLLAVSISMVVYYFQDTLLLKGNK